eukprot:1520994-Ditylum_brightwellii.AAC.1
MYDTKQCQMPHLRQYIELYDGIFKGRGRRQYILKGTYISTFQKSPNRSGKGISCTKSQLKVIKLESAFPVVRPLWQCVQYCWKALSMSNGVQCKKCPFQKGFRSFGA